MKRPRDRKPTTRKRTEARKNYALKAEPGHFVVQGSPIGAHASLKAEPGEFKVEGSDVRMEAYQRPGPQHTLGAAVASTLGVTEPLPVSPPGRRTDRRGAFDGIAFDRNAFQTSTPAAPAGTTRWFFEAASSSDPISLEQLTSLRNAARALSDQFSAQIEELRPFKPNHYADLVRYESLTGLLENVATGLAAFADAIDKAINNATDGRPEPVFLGTAGKIAQQLHVGLMEWLEANRTTVFDIPIRVGLLVGGVCFLQAFGADSWAAVTGLSALLLKSSPKTSAAPKSAQDTKRTGPKTGRPRR